jgi:hypothetical protein
MGRVLRHGGGRADPEPDASGVIRGSRGRSLRAVGCWAVGCWVVGGWVVGGWVVGGWAVGLPGRLAAARTAATGWRRTTLRRTPFHPAPCKTRRCGAELDQRVERSAQLGDVPAHVGGHCRVDSLAPTAPVPRSIRPAQERRSPRRTCQLILTRTAAPAPRCRQTWTSVVGPMAPGLSPPVDVGDLG